MDKVELSTVVVHGTIIGALVAYSVITSRNDEGSNLDTGAAVALTAENSPYRAELTGVVFGRPIFMCETAISEFENIYFRSAGPREIVRANALLRQVVPVLDNPSPRARALRPMNNLELSDIMIFGTGDELGLLTVTLDARAVRAASAQGVNFYVYHIPLPLLPYSYKGL